MMRNRSYVIISLKLIMLFDQFCIVFTSSILRFNRLASSLNQISSNINLIGADRADFKWWLNNFNLT